MSDSKLKAWKVYDDSNDPMYTMAVLAETAGQAKSLYDNWNGVDFTELHAQRLPWLDGIDPASFEGARLMIRHGWTFVLGDCEFTEDSMTPERWERLRKGLEGE